MNKQRMLLVAILLTIFTLNIVPLWAQSTPNYTLFDGVITSGGGTLSGGKYRISANVGQSLVGTSSGGDYTISAGFWANSDGAGGNKVFLPLVRR